MTDDRPAGAPVLRVEGLRKRFGAFEAVRDVSFSIAAGETLGFLGRNGAGKSTTLRMLCNLIRADAGQAWLDDRPMLGGADVAHRRRMGAIIDAPRFYPQLSGRRNLGLLARLLGLAPDRVEALLARVGLAERAEVPFGQYSMGMKQRLGLAAVFLHQPALVILDEPTNGLDPVGQRRLRDLITALAREEGAAILLCSHLLDEVAELCDRAVVIERGALILEQALRGGEALRTGGIEAVAACFRELADADGGAA